MQQLCSGEPLGSLQYASPSPHCGRCAVVGSAGSLLCHRYGAEIDGHGVVMRANAAPTLTHEYHLRDRLRGMSFNKGERDLSAL